ncbi:MAG: hypothetical protein ACE5IB_07720 [Candidatus Geothermarchaeales archaeon]
MTYSQLFSRVEGKGRGRGRFNYHLNVLRKAGLLQQENGAYSLTARGEAALVLLEEGLSVGYGTTSGISRRTLLKVAALAAGAGFVGGSIPALMAYLARSPPLDVQDTFVYEATNVRSGDVQLTQWYEDLVGQEARFSDFGPGIGANVVWKLPREKKSASLTWDPPALLIQVNEEDLEFPPRYSRTEFVIDGLYAIFNVCTFEGCETYWKLISRSQYLMDPGYDAIHCQCHSSSWNPLRIAEYRHPPPPEGSGERYIGVFKEPGFGPADRGMPLIPIERRGDKIAGRMEDPAWYRYLSYVELL